MNDLNPYHSVRDLMAPGDIIAFGGEGFVSDAIKFFTRSVVSHIGIVFETTGLAGERRIILAEATSLNGKSGAQFNPLSERIAAYPGRVWWLPLSARTRAQLDTTAMLEFLKAQDGRPYDFRGIGAFLARPVPGLGQIPFFHHGAADAWFCSEYAVGAFKAGGLPIGIETDEVQPQDFCTLPLYDRCVQLAGRPKSIRNFNRG